MTKLDVQYAAALATNPDKAASNILVKTGYEMGAHPPESADWLNVLLSQVSWFFRVRIADTTINRCYKGIETILYLQAETKALVVVWKSASIPKAEL